MNRKHSIPKKAVAISLALALCLAALTGCGAASKVRSFIAQHLNRATAAEVLPDSAVRDTQAAKATAAVDNGDVTVMVYMNGSNLESEAGMATADLAEIIAAGYSDNVNVVIQTMGTLEWQNYGIASNHSQRYKVGKSGLELVDNSLGQLDCTDPSTLSSFISWAAKNYPAQRYELIMWDHGGGPVYGFGYDEWQDEDAALTLDEMQSALKDAGVYFDFIGFDACIMSTIEVCYALYDYCDYTILSEDFETGIGWYYTDWVKALYGNTDIETNTLGKTIVDSMVSANEKDQVNGDEAILAVIDESMMKVLYTAWTDFAYANTSSLTGSNYSRQITKSTRALTRPMGDFYGGGYGGPSGSYGGYGGPSGSYGGYDDFNSLFSGWEYTDESSVTMSDYYITDIMAVAQTVSSDESKALSAALAEAIVYMNATSGESDLTGLSVTLPYGDSQFYSELSTIFKNCGFDSEYITWLGNFVSAGGTSSFYDFGSFDNSWSGWDNYSDSFDWSSWSYNSSDYWNTISSLFDYGSSLLND